MVKNLQKITAILILAGGSPCISAAEAQLSYPSRRNPAGTRGSHCSSIFSVDTEIAQALVKVQGAKTNFENRIDYLIQRIKEIEIGIIFNMDFSSYREEDPGKKAYIESLRTTAREEIAHLRQEQKNLLVDFLKSVSEFLTLRGVTHEFDSDSSSQIIITPSRATPLNRLALAMVQAIRLEYLPKLSVELNFNPLAGARCGFLSALNVHLDMRSIEVSLYEGALLGDLDSTSMNHVLHEVSTHFRTIADEIHRRPNPLFGKRRHIPKNESDPLWIKAKEASYHDYLSFDEPFAVFREIQNLLKDGKTEEARELARFAKKLLVEIPKLCDQVLWNPKSISFHDSTNAYEATYAKIALNSKSDFESVEVSVPLIQSQGAKDPGNLNFLRLQMQSLQLEAAVLEKKLNDVLAQPI